jgi:multidrug efflux pump subunit AcrA (membrane-fusion protein)
LLLTALAVAVVALACALAPRIGWPASQAQSVGGETLEASGVIRAQEVLIASEWGGHIAAILVDEGEAVAAGDLLVQLDTALLDAQIKAARAVIAVAEAGLAQVETGARPGQIKAAEAQLAQVQAARAAATQAVSDTLALVENPQDIRLQIAVTQAQAEAAQHDVARAVVLKDAAEIGKDKFEKVRGKAGDRKVLVRSGPVSELPAILPPEIVGLLPTLGDGVYTFGDLVLHLHGGTYDLYKWINVHVPFELHLMPNNWWQAWVGVNAAVAQQEGIQASLAHLYAQRAHPQSLEAMADEALAALAQSGAQVAAAQAQVSALKAGATREQIAARKARVAQAQAALDSLLTQRAMIEIVAPTDGVVVDVMAHSGEVASAGASLLTIADLSQVTLVVYVPENQIGRVRLDQRVQVTVDSFSDRVFAGQVAYISGRAEFTPRNVATKEERVNLVFAVEVHISNDDSALKPGMPADATFGG